MNDNYTYADLTPDHIKRANGCGSSFWLAAVFRLPRFLFPRISKACDCHDVGYRNGDPDDTDEKQALDAQLVEDIRCIAMEESRVALKKILMGVSNLVEYALNTKISAMCWREATKK